MKIKIITRVAASILCTLPLLATAQSNVTLYGEIDTGIQFLTHAGANGGNQWSMASAGYQPSLFGLTGTEDLGGGYRALFRLEQGINSNDGSALIPGDMFARAAYVGIANDNLGTLTAGRQFSVLFDNTIIYDPTFFSNYSLFSDYFIPLSNVWVNNSVKYRSPILGGFTAEALYGFGDQIAGDSRSGRVMEVSLKYTQGGFAGSATWAQTNGSHEPGAAASASGELDTRAALAARYAFDRLTIYAGYENISGSLQLTPRGNTYFVGLGYDVSPFLKLTGQVYRYDQGGSSASTMGYVASAGYLLSKRTTLYANVGYVNNRNGANFGLNPYTTTANGQSQFGTTVGILHRF
ncbi:porin [Paraburkholderia sp. ZP32-5]|uniref:porin n=1 Tax=Paraburkholderia sp. ZP32-5 TaxID=2883245 RepID=UPI001F3198A9|nr:porin [Paraburkholderia sp. ZP32-5]